MSNVLPAFVIGLTVVFLTPFHARLEKSDEGPTGRLRVGGFGSSNLIYVLLGVFFAWLASVGSPLAAVTALGMLMLAFFCRKPVGWTVLPLNETERGHRGRGVLTGMTVTVVYVVLVALLELVMPNPTRTIVQISLGLALLAFALVRLFRSRGTVRVLYW